MNPEGTLREERGVQPRTVFARPHGAELIEYDRPVDSLPEEQLQIVMAVDHALGRCGQILLRDGVRAGGAHGNYHLAVFRKAQLFIDLLALAVVIVCAYRAARAANELANELASQITGDGSQYYLVDPDIEMPTIDIGDRDCVGYVEIPALGLSLPVLSEWSYPNLKVAPCRYKGSIYLDDMIIAAHNYRTHFGTLESLEPGTQVIFTDTDGNRFEYEVSQLELLNGTDVEKMEEGDWDLTLFTCTVGGRQRVTVRCTRTSDFGAYDPNAQAQ